jgi:hypothetical protein
VVLAQEGGWPCLGQQRVSWEEPDLTLVRREEALCVGYLFVCLFVCFHLTLETFCEVLSFDYHFIYLFISE